MSSGTLTHASSEKERGPRDSMETDQRKARIFGVLFIITFLTSLPAYFMFQSMIEDPVGFIASSGSNTLVLAAVVLELFLILANVGTAVVLYPIVRRQNRVLALGFVGARILESVFIAVGIIFVLGLVSLRQDSPEAADLALSLAAMKDWTFLFGPGLIVPFGNGLILGYLMYKSGLVPRPLALLGMVAGPILLISSFGTLFDAGWTGGVATEGGLVPLLLVAPEFIWEISLGIYCAIWGFRRDSPILQAPPES